jgi:RNA polymerase-binding transcription factor DksA
MAAKKPAPKKAIAKKVVKSAPKKVTPVKKAAAKPAPKKVAAKPVAKKAPAKPAPAKAAPKKAAPKKAVAKPLAKKAAVKPVAKKVTPKPVVKKAAAKPVAKKPVAKPTVNKTAVKASVAKKPIAKAAPQKEIKKIASKPVKIVKEKPVKVVKEKPAKIEKVKIIKEKIVKPKKADKKSGPTKTLITSSNNTLPKRIDAYKTNTFAAPNLKNDTGKVIAHRKTRDMKRKGEDELMVKKYEPESRRSILDNTTADTSPSYRYSDEDLMEFRELIQRKLETAKNELQYLQAVIMRKDEGGTEDTENKYQSIEDGSASMDREQFTQLASRQISFITHLEQALVRIENKTYGICRDTGKLIDKARLRAVPHATLSIEAKNAKKN